MSKGFKINIKPEEYFRLSNGRILKNLYELMNALKSMDEDIFISHVNESKNDFGNWVKYVFRDEELSKSIFDSKTREDVLKTIKISLDKKAPAIKILVNSSPKKNNKIEEILMKEKEIEKREVKIEEIEGRIEKELADLSAKKEPKFLSKEFIQGLLIGLLSASIIGLIYIKFFA